MNTLGKLTGSVHAERGQVTVSVAGEVDLATAPQFKALMDAALAFGATQVTVDMTRVSFIDAQALEILTRAAARLKLGGGRLVVHNASPQSYRVLELTHLLQELGVEAPNRLAPDDGGAGVLAMSTNVRDVLDSALALVVSMAAAVVHGADGVSITLPRQGAFTTVAASDDVVLGMDHDQYDTHQGPCLDAAGLGRRFLVKDLRHETRWPEFVPRARARGIESIVSTPLMTGERVLGALNVYSRQAGVVAEHELEWVDRFAAGASKVLTDAEDSPSEQALLSDLQGRLRSRDVIATAQGVVMERDGLTQPAAHRKLIGTSRSTSQPLLEVCADVLSSMRSTA